ncbi:hypothetical protein LTR37_002997 [Vermiconidia calcicola]|uniref:Uncharacterized protein n=1 Tax=Vermiconidia calcicola TaxID=1690605 RepID=A0ACC3NRG5_9PEZI|nr:hypothetical protein LTR37_002997 [Vermiconidia calcicola]
MPTLIDDIGNCERREVSEPNNLNEDQYNKGDRNGSTSENDEQNQQSSQHDQENRNNRYVPAEPQDGVPLPRSTKGDARVADARERDTARTGPSVTVSDQITTQASASSRPICQHLVKTRPPSTPGAKNEEPDCPNCRADQLESVDIPEANRKVDELEARMTEMQQELTRQKSDRDLWLSHKQECIQQREDALQECEDILFREIRYAGYKAFWEGRRPYYSLWSQAANTRRHEQTKRESSRETQSISPRPPQSCAPEPEQPPPPLNQEHVTPPPPPQPAEPGTLKMKDLHWLAKEAALISSGNLQQQPLATGSFATKPRPSPLRYDQTKLKGLDPYKQERWQSLQDLKREFQQHKTTVSNRLKYDLRRHQQFVRNEFEAKLKELRQTHHTQTERLDTKLQQLENQVSQGADSELFKMLVEQCEAMEGDLDVLKSHPALNEKQPAETTSTPRPKPATAETTSTLKPEPAVAESTTATEARFKKMEDRLNEQAEWIETLSNDNDKLRESRSPNAELVLLQKEVDVLKKAQLQKEIKELKSAESALTNQQTVQGTELTAHRQSLTKHGQDIALQGQSIVGMHNDMKVLWDKAFGVPPA